MAICDEIFPDLTRVVKDPNSLFALALRGRFPTPQTLTSASFTTLQEIRGGARSLSDAKLLELSTLAAQSSGVKDVARLRGLVLEQSQLITELRLLREHV